MKSSKPLFVLMSICFTFIACEQKSNLYRSVQDVEGQKQKAIEEKYSSENEQLMDRIASGGEPGNLSLIGDGFYETPIEQNKNIKINFSTGTSWRKEIKLVSKSALNSSSFHAAEPIVNTADSEITENSASIGCDNKSVPLAIKTQNLEFYRLIKTSTLRICGLLKSDSPLIIYADKLILDSAFITVSTDSEQALTIIANDLAVSGNSAIIVQNKPSESTQKKGVNALIQAKVTSWQGELAIYMIGASYKAPPAAK